MAMRWSSRSGAGNISGTVATEMFTMRSLGEMLILLATCCRKALSLTAVDPSGRFSATARVQKPYEGYRASPG